MIAKSRLEQFNSVPTFRLTGLANGRDQLWKRAMDIGLAVVCGIPAAVVILLAAIALKIESPRAPVFTPGRVSRHGRIFRLYKLRTMIPMRKKYRPGSCRQG